MSTMLSACLNLTTAIGNDGNTYPQQLFYRAPYKLTNYFRLPDGGIEYMIMNASAGIMAGDHYQITITVGSRTKLVITSQSFEKIHRMEQGEARRDTEIAVASDGELHYLPLPCIPYQSSAFSSQTKIILADESSRLIFLDIIGCGRHLRGERYGYRYLKSRSEVWRGNKPLFIDNYNFNPAQTDLHQLGMLEGYNYVVTLLIYGYTLTNARKNKIRTLFESTTVTAALTELPGNGHLVRILALKADAISELIPKIIQLVTDRFN